MAKDGPGADVADHFAEINILDSEAIIDYIEKTKFLLFTLQVQT